MKLFIGVIPNSLNESACVFVVHKGWKWYNWEVGRLTSQKDLDLFIKTYLQLNGREIQL